MLYRSIVASGTLGYVLCRAVLYMELVYGGGGFVSCMGGVYFMYIAFVAHVVVSPSNLLNYSMKYQGQ